MALFMKERYDEYEEDYYRYLEERLDRDKS